MGVAAQVLSATPHHAPSGSMEAHGLQPDFPDDPSSSIASAGSAHIEAVITKALVYVLGAGELDRSGNFFELGCNSLKALELAQHLRPLLGRDVQVVDIYRFPTAPALASFLTGGDPAALGMRQAHRSAQPRAQLEAHAAAQLRQAGLALDYAVLRRPDLTEPADGEPGPRVALVAARLGTTRLIDNLEF